MSEYLLETGKGEKYIVEADHILVDKDGHLFLYRADDTCIFMTKDEWRGLALIKQKP